MANRNAEFSTIEDSRYTMEKAIKSGLLNQRGITPPKNWRKMIHTELVEFFEKNNIKMCKKPRQRQRNA